MAEHFRIGKIKKFIERLENRMNTTDDPVKKETLSEVISEMRHEFGLEKPTPYGYKSDNGETIVDEYQFKVVNLIFELRTLGIDEEEIKQVLNEFKVPKVQVDGFDLDSIKGKLVDRAKEILEERLMKKEE